MAQVPTTKGDARQAIPEQLHSARLHDLQRLGPLRKRSTSSAATSGESAHTSWCRSRVDRLSPSSSSLSKRLVPQNPAQDVVGQRRSADPYSNHQNRDSPILRENEIRFFRFHPVFVHHVRWHQPGYQEQAEWHNDQIVEIPEDRNEIRNQIDWTQSIRHD